MSRTIPTSNLPNDAVKWGRIVQNSALSSERKIENLHTLLLGQNSSSAGQLGAIGQTISAAQEEADRSQSVAQELAARASGSATISYIVEVVNAPLNSQVSYSPSATLQLPPTPDGEVRDGIAFITFEAYNSQPDDTTGSLHVRVGGWRDGQRRYSKAIANPVQTTTPPNWTGAYTLSGPIRTSQAEMDIQVAGTVYRWGGSGNVSVGIRNVRGVVIYGGK